MLRWLILLSRNPPFIISPKAYPTVDSQSAKFVTILGSVCSIIGLLPASSILSPTLEIRGNVVVASGGFTDIWRGEYHGAQVAIKAFRIYPAQGLEEAKKVSIQPTWVVSPRTKFAGSVEAGADVEKAIS